MGLRRLSANVVWGVAGLAVVFAAWFAAVEVLAVPAVFFPPPLDVLERIQASFLRDRSLALYGVPENLWQNLIYTIQNVLLSVGFGTTIGCALGWLSARSGVVRALVFPILASLGTVPLLIAIPFFVVWFGTDRFSGVAFVTLYTSLVLILFSQRAADNLDPVYESAARTLGATRWMLLASVVIPGTIPGIIGGIRIATAGAWGLEAVAEFLFLPQGMGKVILAWAGALDTDGIMAAVLVVTSVAVLFDALFVALLRSMSRWTAG